MEKSIGFDFRTLVQVPSIALTVLWPWAVHLAFRTLSFFLNKMGKIVSVSPTFEEEMTKEARLMRGPCTGPDAHLDRSFAAFLWEPGLVAEILVAGGPGWPGNGKCQPEALFPVGPGEANLPPGWSLGGKGNERPWFSCLVIVCGTPCQGLSWDGLRTVSLRLQMSSPRPRVWPPGAEGSCLSLRSLFLYPDVLRTLGLLER